ncbi:MAG: sensor histidine kinase [Firmicutes bacterium HGW-Firmicutes-16]|nr:MAG: sensor histidine kinase [Firmicutes bacterium HGW-Firmicutes-16]
MTLAPVDEAVNVIVSLLPISILMCVVIAIAFSLLYARAITHPIKAISDETRHMTLLERGAQCKIQSKDEFGELAANVNGLYDNLLSTIDSLEAELKKVASAEKAKTDFLRAASHELKTPATAVSVIMDNMILGVGKYKDHEQWLPKCKELVDSLSDKLRNILDASRLEAISEPFVTENVETLCSGVLDPYIIIARAKGLSLYIDWSASFLVTAPQELLGKALSNIFSNAVLYTAPGGKFSVYCKGHSLVVENECEPIPQELIKRLYEPFYRPDISRSRETGGNGLGLYIVETALCRLELDYSFDTMTSPEGMRFTISF